MQYSNQRQTSVGYVIELALEPRCTHVSKLAFDLMAALDFYNNTA